MCKTCKCLSIRVWLILSNCVLIIFANHVDYYRYNNMTTNNKGLLCSTNYSFWTCYFYLAS